MSEPRFRYYIQFNIKGNSVEVEAFINPIYMQTLKTGYSTLNFKFL